MNTEQTSKNIFMYIVFIAYELDKWSCKLHNDFTLKDCLIGALKLTKNAHSDKSFYSGYGTGLVQSQIFKVQILI